MRSDWRFLFTHKMSSAITHDQSDFNIIFIHSSLDDAGLSCAAFRVYCHFARRANKGKAFPGIDSIARICRLAKNTVVAAIKELENTRMLIAQRYPGKVTIYELTKTAVWLLPSQTEERSTVANGGTVNRRKVGNAPSQTEERTVANEVTKGDPLTKSREGKTDLGMRSFTDSWCAEFQTKFGIKYKFNGRDGKAASELLSAGYTGEEIISVAKSAWNQPDEFWCKHAATLPGMASHFNAIRVATKTGNALPNGVRRGQMPPKMQPSQIEHVSGRIAL